MINKYHQMLTHGSCMLTTRFQPCLTLPRREYFAVLCTTSAAAAVAMCAHAIPTWPCTTAFHTNCGVQVDSQGKFKEDNFQKAMTATGATSSDVTAFKQQKRTGRGEESDIFKLVAVLAERALDPVRAPRSHRRASSAPPAATMLVGSGRPSQQFAKSLHSLLSSGLACSATCLVVSRARVCRQSACAACRSSCLR
jgi:hypothetical protein